MMQAATKKFGRATGGAVAVEFTIVVMPLFFVFFGFWQIAALLTANLAIKHTANVVARAGAVMEGPKTTPEGDGKHRPKNFVKAGGLLLAANEAIGPWSSGLHMVVSKATVTYADDPADPYGDVTSHVEAYFFCEIPLGKRMVCGFLPWKTIASNAHGSPEVKFAHQGANYSP